jgi:hypothetical protein
VASLVYLQQEENPALLIAEDLLCAAGVPRRSALSLILAKKTIKTSIVAFNFE